MFKRIIAEIDSVFARDPAARTRLEVFFCYPGLHAILAYRLTHWLWKHNLKFAARLLSYLARIITGIEIHPGARIGERLFIDHGFGVVIGETATIGNDVTIYHDVTLGGTSLKKEIRHPQLGDRVIIGAGAQLLGPIWVGDDARIGSNAVVVTDVAAGQTVVGVPARVVTLNLDQQTVANPPKTATLFEAYATTRGDIAQASASALEDMQAALVALGQRVAQLESQQQGIESTAKSWEIKE